MLMGSITNVQFLVYFLYINECIFPEGLIHCPLSSDHLLLTFSVAAAFYKYIYQMIELLLYQFFFFYMQNVFNRMLANS